MSLCSQPDFPFPRQLVFLPSAFLQHFVSFSATVFIFCSVHGPFSCHQTGNNMKIGTAFFSLYSSPSNSSGWGVIIHQWKYPAEECWNCGEAVCSCCSKASIHITCHFSPMLVMQNQQRQHSHYTLLAHICNMWHFLWNTVKGNPSLSNL